MQPHMLKEILHMHTVYICATADQHVLECTSKGPHTNPDVGFRFKTLNN